MLRDFTVQICEVVKKNNTIHIKFYLGTSTSTLDERQFLPSDYVQITDSTTR